MSKSLEISPYKVDIRYDADCNPYYSSIVKYLDDDGQLLKDLIVYKPETPEFDAFFEVERQCCSPYIDGFRANAKPDNLENFNSFSIFVGSSACAQKCNLLVEISCKGQIIGSFPIPTNVGEFCPFEFNCLMDDISVTESSDNDECLNDVYVYIQRRQ